MLFTGLNFLFFWMTWTTLVLSHSPLRVELFGTLAIRLVFYLAPSIFFFLFDSILPHAAYSIKAQGQIALPSGHKRRKISRTEVKIIGWSLFNIFLSIAVQGAAEFTLTTVLRWRSLIKVAVRLPYPWGITIDIVRGFIVREVREKKKKETGPLPLACAQLPLFACCLCLLLTVACLYQIMNYAIHRFILHSPRLCLARLHENWYHGLKAPWPLTAHYDHPLCYLLWKFIPIYAPAALFRFHMITYMTFLALVSLEETWTHSGYSTMPMGFVLGGMARRTEMHVISGGDGNYGAWGILDWLGGSTADESETFEDDVQAQIADSDIDARIRKAVLQAKSDMAEVASREKVKTRRRAVG